MQSITENRTVQLGFEEWRGCPQMVFWNHRLSPHPPTSECIKRTYKSCLCSQDLVGCPAHSRRSKHFSNGQIRQTAQFMSHSISGTVFSELLANYWSRIVWNACNMIKNSQWRCKWGRREKTLISQVPLRPSLVGLMPRPWPAAPRPNTHTRQLTGPQAPPPTSSPWSSHLLFPPR